MKKRIRLTIASYALAGIAAFLIWKFMPWAKLSAWYAAFLISDLPPVWYYSTVILLAVLLMVVVWFVLQIIPKRQARALQPQQKKVAVNGQEIDEEGSIYIPQSSIKPTELFSIENEARKTLSQIIGGFIVIVSLILTGANLAITSRLTQEGQITDRFTKAITQLGDKDKLEVRLGGIYALERIANDSEKDRWTIMEVLTAYIRENAPRKNESTASATKKVKSKRPLPESNPEIVKLPTDIQAILTVIGRRKAYRNLNSLDLRETSLSGANLSGANLSWADLSKANLGRAYLSEAFLLGTYFISADLSRANLSGANLSGANLSGANLTLANLNGANLSRATLRWADLSGSDLTLANLSKTNLSWVKFSGADLSGADLSGADLSWAILSQTDLSGAKLSGAKLSMADLTWANLTGAGLTGANLIGAKNIDWELISEAIIDDDTKLPPEIESQHKDELKAMREKTRKYDK